MINQNAVYSFLTSGDFFRLLISIANSLDKTKVLIWINTVRHIDNVHEIIFRKS